MVGEKGDEIDPVRTSYSASIGWVVLGGVQPGVAACGSTVLLHGSQGAGIHRRHAHQLQRRGGAGGGGNQSCANDKLATSGKAALGQNCKVCGALVLPRAVGGGVRCRGHILVPDGAAACLADRNLLTSNRHRYAYDKVVSEIEERVARWTHLPRENQEPLEVGWQGRKRQRGVVLGC